MFAAVAITTAVAETRLHADAGGTDPATGERAATWEATLRADLGRMTQNLTASLKPWPVPAGRFLAEDYGAKADGKTDNTASVQKAVDACAAAGGGAVLLTKGAYVIDAIHLKSGVMLEVGKNAVLEDIYAIPNLSQTKAKVLVLADHCNHVGIRGLGELVGPGPDGHFNDRNAKGTARRRLFGFMKCTQVVVDGIHVRNNGPAWSDFTECDDVIIQGINVENQACRFNDGLDICGCRNVIVRDCFVNSEDDGCCFKENSNRSMENVLVENCKFYSTCSALKLGTASKGGFRNVVVRNVEVGGPSADMPAIDRRLAIAGISWESVDGGVVENILCSQVHIVRTESPLYLRLGHRDRSKGVGAIRRVIFDHVSGKDNGIRGSIFTGIPGAAIEDVIVRDATILVSGGGEAQKPKGEMEDSYPDAWIFGRQSPAYGFWLRHAHNIAFFNVAVTPQKSDARRAYGLDADVSNATLDGKDLSDSLNRTDNGLITAPASQTNSSQ